MSLSHLLNSDQGSSLNQGLESYGSQVAFRPPSYVEESSKSDNYDLYGSDDESYVNTPLNSGIPPPQDEQVFTQFIASTKLEEEQGTSSSMLFKISFLV